MAILGVCMGEHFHFITLMVGQALEEQILTLQFEILLAGMVMSGLLYMFHEY